MTLVIVTIKRVTIITTEFLAKRTLWDRGLAAVLNFKKYLVSLRDTGICPAVFSKKPTSKNI
ncbi:hypothetical protein BDF21DRAFT_481868 [Thamnidium elegans]|nr:hypothetical protein BDF21DRAFT_481868 [Thamnidium elegans]